MGGTGRESGCAESLAGVSGCKKALRGWGIAMIPTRAKQTNGTLRELVPLINDSFYYNTAKNNSLVLLPIGIIKEHGPHMDLSPDVYVAYLFCKLLKKKLWL